MIHDDDRYYEARCAEAPDGWPFDARRDDPLTAHRIAVTCSHPGWAYLVAFDYESAVRPTEAETGLLVSFLDEYKQQWYGDSGYRQRMEARPLDVDGGSNGVIFHKWGADDWGYRRQSYDRGWLFSVIPPAQRGKHTDGIHGPFSLLGLMDRIRSFGDEPFKHWAEWKLAHPEVFAPAGTDAVPTC